VNRRPARVPRAAAALPLLALTVALTVAGCGDTSSAPATHVMSDGQTMSGSSMSGSDDRGNEGDAGGTGGMAAGAAMEGPGPSEAAAMVCSDEVRDAVARTLQVDRVPSGLHAWGHDLFRCSYLLGAGELRLSVKDLDADGRGRAWFDGLRARLPQARSLRGVAALGLPSFETPRGDVVFLKDHKTLRVDASRLAERRLPAGMSRTDVAYGVAAAVVACWSE
jgi:hypothetical protein